MVHAGSGKLMTCGSRKDEFSRLSLRKGDFLGDFEYFAGNRTSKLTKEKLT